MLLSSSGVSLAGPRLDELVAQLRRGEDFRMRVQAALELGKLKDGEALGALTDALDDDHTSVRVAAVTALEVLGDRRAIEALKEHRLDPSAAVRKQIKIALSALATDDEKKKVAKVVVKLGAMRGGSDGGAGVAGALTQASRDQLRRLPQVWVLDDGEEPETSKARRVPLVLVTGRIQKLRVSREGRDFTYSAQVEYVLHRMPEQAIMGKVSGSASAKASAAEVRDESKRAELRRAVLDAAVASAVSRAPAALLAAAEL
jgi:hypothetical protein